MTGSKGPEATATALETRAGLPDALRALSDAWPREGWEAHPHFEGLVRFWMDRHMGFRKLTGLLLEDARGLIDGRIAPEAYSSRLSRLGGLFVNDLHGHHQIEDMHYFPRLAAAEPAFAAGFAILDRDHHAIDGHLQHFVESANATLAARAEDARLREAAAGFEAGMARLAGLLERHLTDEEDLVVPVILKHGPGGLD